MGVYDSCRCRERIHMAKGISQWSEHRPKWWSRTLWQSECYTLTKNQMCHESTKPIDVDIFCSWQDHKMDPLQLKDCQNRKSTRYDGQTSFSQHQALFGLNWFVVPKVLEEHFDETSCWNVHNLKNSRWRFVKMWLEFWPNQSLTRPMFVQYQCNSHAKNVQQLFKISIDFMQYASGLYILLVDFESFLFKWGSNWFMKKREKEELRFLLVREWVFLLRENK